LYAHRGRQNEETRLDGPNRHRPEDRHPARRLDGRQGRPVAHHLEPVQGTEDEANLIETLGLRDERIVDLILLADLWAVADRESQLDGCLGTARSHGLHHARQSLDGGVDRRCSVCLGPGVKGQMGLRAAPIAAAGQTDRGQPGPPSEGGSCSWHPLEFRANRPTHIITRAHPCASALRAARRSRALKIRSDGFFDNSATGVSCAPGVVNFREERRFSARSDLAPHPASRGGSSMAASCSRRSPMYPSQYRASPNQGKALGNAGSSHRWQTQAAWCSMRRLLSGSMSLSSRKSKSANCL